MNGVIISRLEHSLDLSPVLIGFFCRVELQNVCLFVHPSVWMFCLGEIKMKRLLEHMNVDLGNFDVKCLSSSSMNIDIRLQI